jgi:hypothetical protein
MTPMGGGIARHTTVQLTSLLMMLRSMMQQEGHSGHSANAQRERLHGSEFRHVPRRVSGSEETVVPAGGDDRIDVLA